MIFLLLTCWLFSTNCIGQFSFSLSADRQSEDIVPWCDVITVEGVITNVNSTDKFYRVVYEYDNTLYEYIGGGTLNTVGTTDIVTLLEDVPGNSTSNNQFLLLLHLKAPVDVDDDHTITASINQTDDPEVSGTPEADVDINPTHEYAYADGSAGAVDLSTLIGTDPNEDYPQELHDLAVGNMENQSLVVEGTLIIDEDYHFREASNSIGGIFLMEGARIIIADEKKLTLEDLHIFGCTDLWESIEVQTGGELLIGGCVIEDGLAAIHAQRGSVIHQVVGTDFIDNVTGIYLSNEGSSFSIAQLGWFASNSFSGTGSMLPVFSNPPEIPWASSHISSEIPLAGVYIDAQYSFDAVTLNSSPFLGNPNSFENMANGIVGTQLGHLEVRVAYFENMTAPETSLPYAGNGIYFEGVQGDGGLGILRVIGHPSSNVDAEFKDCASHGIYAETVSDVLIQSYRFNEVFKGIHIVNDNMATGLVVNRIDILNNTINADNAGIDIRHSHPQETGIIDNNEISVRGPVAAFPWAAIFISDDMMAFESGRWVITNNEINSHNARHGILFAGDGTAQIFQNTISILENGTQVFNPRFGILTSGTFNPRHRCNIISGTTLAQPGRYGLASFGNSFIGFAQCNVFDSTHIGVQYFDAMFANYDAAGNEFRDHGIGLLLGEDGAGTTMTEIQPQFHRGNLWTGSYGVIGARNVAALPPWITDNRFTVDDGANADFEPSWDTPNYLGQENWFEDIGALNTFACTTTEDTVCQDAIVGVPELEEREIDWESDFLEKTAQDSLQFDEYEEALRWRARQMLTYLLLRDETRADTIDVYADFLDSVQVSGERDYTDVSIGIADLWIRDSSFQQHVSDYRDTLTEVNDSIYVIDTLLAAGASGQDSIDLLSDRDSLVTLQRDILEILDSLRAIQLDTIVAHADELWSDNDNLSATEIYEKNEKKVNDILLTAIKNDTILTRDNIDTLITIANQCPISGGIAVYRARGLVGSDTTEYDDFTNCIVSRSARDEHSDLPDIAELKVFPNPTAGQVTVLLPEIQDEARLLLTDGLGKVKAEFTVLPGESRKLLSLSDYAPGFYFLVLLEEGEILSRQTLVISR